MRTLIVATTICALVLAVTASALARPNATNAASHGPIADSQSSYTANPERTLEARRNPCKRFRNSARRQRCNRARATSLWYAIKVEFDGLLAEDFPGGRSFVVTENWVNHGVVRLQRGCRLVDRFGPLGGRCTRAQRKNGALPVVFFATGLRNGILEDYRAEATNPTFCGDRVTVNTPTGNNWFSFTLSTEPDDRSAIRIKNLVFEVTSIRSNTPELTCTDPATGFDITIVGSDIPDADTYQFLGSDVRFPGNLGAKLAMNLTKSWGKKSFSITKSVSSFENPPPPGTITQANVNFTFSFELCPRNGKTRKGCSSPRGA